MAVRMRTKAMVFCSGLEIRAYAPARREMMVGIISPSRLNSFPLCSSELEVVSQILSFCRSAGSHLGGSACGRLGRVSRLTPGPAVTVYDRLARLFFSFLLCLVLEDFTSPHDETHILQLLIRPEDTIHGDDSAKAPARISPICPCCRATRRRRESHWRWRPSASCRISQCTRIPARSLGPGNRRHRAECNLPFGLERFLKRIS